MRLNRLITSGAVAVCTALAVTAVCGSAADASSRSSRTAPATSASKPAPKPTPHKPTEEQAVTPLYAPCGVSAPNLDGTISHTTSNYVNMRSGSATVCGIYGQAQMSHRLVYYCVTHGYDDANWTYVYNLSTSRGGWIREDLLSGRGSSVFCGF